MYVEQVAEPGAEWDAFVEATPGAALGHAAAWPRILRRAYGLRSLCLAARRDGVLAGVVCLVRFRTLQGRRELVSLPFLDSGGLLARDEEAARALLTAACDRARALGASALELRHAGPVAGLSEAPPQSRVDLVLALEGSEEAQWKAVGSKVRNQTRKAEREGLSIAGGTPEALLPGFYDPFRANMRDLGSPVHGEGFFRAMAEAFGERLRFVVTELAARPVGGLVAVDYAGVVSIPWASTLRAERARCPNNLIYWEALRWALARGVREVDFGRSPRDGGTYRFKRGWGAVERPLHWVRLSPDGRPLPAAAPGAALQRLSRTWSRLPPALADLLGPRIRRFLSN